MNDNIVKKTCKELGITQKELAEIIGVAEITVSQWSRGINKIPDWAIITFTLLKKIRKYENQDEAIEKAIKILRDAIK